MISAATVSVRLALHVATNSQSLKKRKNRFSVNLQNLLYTILSESTVVHTFPATLLVYCSAIFPQGMTFRYSLVGRLSPTGMYRLILVIWYFRKITLSQVEVLWPPRLEYLMLTENTYNSLEI